MYSRGNKVLQIGIVSLMRSVRTYVRKYVASSIAYGMCHENALGVFFVVGHLPLFERCSTAADFAPWAFPLAARSAHLHYSRSSFFSKRQEMPRNVENLVKQRLGIKYIDAKRLTEEAEDLLKGEDVPITEEDVVEEAVALFEEMTLEEQEAMKIPEESGEPEWKRKAREQAERREKEWAEAEAQRQAEVVQERQEQALSNEGTAAAVQAGRLTAQEAAKGKTTVKVKKIKTKNGGTRTRTIRHGGTGLQA